MDAPVTQVQPGSNDIVRDVFNAVSKLPEALGSFACRTVAIAPTVLFVGVTHLLHKCGVPFKPKSIPDYLVRSGNAGKLIGQSFEEVMMGVSWVTSLPGKVVGYAVGRIVGAVTGTVIVGSAKLINVVFKSGIITKKINEHSIAKAETFQRLGGVASRVAAIFLYPPLLAPIIISGFVFERANAYLREPDTKIGPYTPPIS